jgi:hypothetical protein
VEQTHNPIAAGCLTIVRWIVFFLDLCFCMYIDWLIILSYTNISNIHFSKEIQSVISWTFCICYWDGCSSYYWDYLNQIEVFPGSHCQCRLGVINVLWLDYNSTWKIGCSLNVKWKVEWTFKFNLRMYVGSAICQTFLQTHNPIAVCCLTIVHWFKIYTSQLKVQCSLV